MLFIVSFYVFLDFLSYVRMSVIYRRVLAYNAFHIDSMHIHVEPTHGYYFTITRVLWARADVCSCCLVFQRPIRNRFIFSSDLSTSFTWCYVSLMSSSFATRVRQVM